MISANRPLRTRMMGGVGKGRLNPVPYPISQPSFNRFLFLCHPFLPPLIFDILKNAIDISFATLFTSQMFSGCARKCLNSSFSYYWISFCVINLKLLRPTFTFGNPWIIIFPIHFMFFISNRKRIFFCGGVLFVPINRVPFFLS